MNHGPRERDQEISRRDVRPSEAFALIVLAHSQQQLHFHQRVSGSGNIPMFPRHPPTHIVLPPVTNHRTISPISSLQPSNQVLCLCPRLAQLLSLPDATTRPRGGFDLKCCDLDGRWAMSWYRFRPITRSPRPHIIIGMSMRFCRRASHPGFAVKAYDVQTSI
jgi:hypothetical protein